MSVKMALDLSGIAHMQVVKPNCFSLGVDLSCSNGCNVEVNQQLWCSVESSSSCERCKKRQLSQTWARNSSCCDLGRRQANENQKSQTLILSTAPASPLSLPSAGSISGSKCGCLSVRRGISDAQSLRSQAVITPFSSPTFQNRKPARTNLASSGTISRSGCGVNLAPASPVALEKGPLGEVIATATSLARHGNPGATSKQQTSAMRTCSSGAVLDDHCNGESSECVNVNKILVTNVHAWSAPLMPANALCLEALGEIPCNEEGKTTGTVDGWQSSTKLSGDGRGKLRSRRQCLTVSGITIAGVMLSCLDTCHGNAAEVLKESPSAVEIELGRGENPAAYDFVAMADDSRNDDVDEEESMTIRVFQGATRSIVYIEDVEVTSTGKIAGSSAGSGSASISPEDDMNVKVEGTGSGFIWDRFGHIVTNYHVIAKLAADASGKRACRVRLSQANGMITALNAAVVGLDPSRDLAVLQIEAPADDLLPIPIGSSSDLQVGQNCYAIGNPYGFDHTLTTGVISGLNREIPAPNGMSIKGAIQTDAAINAGNSGGPLLDSFGRLIGVNTATFTRSGSGMSSGVNFAIPVDLVTRVVPQLIVNGTARAQPTRQRAL